MAERPGITLDELKTLARGQAPELGQAIIHLAAQPEPTLETGPEGAIIAEQFEAAAQRVTGMTINDAGPIHNRAKGKPYREGESHAHLQGLAAWVFMSDPKTGAEFLSQVAALPRS